MTSILDPMFFDDTVTCSYGKEALNQMLMDRVLLDPAQKWLLEAVAADDQSWTQYVAS